MVFGNEIPCNPATIPWLSEKKKYPFPYALTTLFPRGAAGADFFRGRPGLWAWPKSLPRRLLVEAGNGTSAVTGAWKAVPGGPLPTRRRRRFFGGGLRDSVREPGRGRGVLVAEACWERNQRSDRYTEGGLASNFSCYLALRRPEQVLLAPAPH